MKSSTDWAATYTAAVVTPWFPVPATAIGDRSLSLSITDGNPPRIVWKSWANDPAEVVWPHLGLERQATRPMSGFELERARRERERARRAELAIKLAFCAAIWRETVEANGTLVETYLRARAIVGPIPPALRFHPAAPLAYPDPSKPTRTFPAMVAIVTGADGKSAVGLHVTALKPDGSDKALGDRSRRMFGDMSGAVVQLGAMAANGVLGVAEGIESSLSYRDLHGPPTWALLSSSLMKIYSPPPGIRRLLIAADADDDGTGLEAARDLARRASRRCDCLVTPAPEGKDWNDVQREAAR